jgi:hypothetical protein
MPDPSAMFDPLWVRLRPSMDKYYTDDYNHDTLLPPSKASVRAGISLSHGIHSKHQKYAIIDPGYV